MASDGILFVLGAIIAVGFAYLLLCWVRGMEIYRRETCPNVLRAFLYGGVVAILGALVLSSILLFPLQGFGDAMPFDMTFVGVIGAVVVAPISEELVKATGILAMRSRLTEVENGIVYGAAVGLGFAATENILYFSAAITAAGALGLIVTAIVRSLTSTFLHLGATGLVGYGIGLYYGAGGRARTWGIYLLGAMAVHAAFNLFASAQAFAATLEGQLIIALLGLLAGLVLTWSIFGWLRRKIRTLDRASAPPYLRES